MRSDYMFHKPDENPPALKQIEINMIASSFIGIGTEKTKSLHEFVLEQSGLRNFASQLPPNKALPNVTQSIVNAWDIYGSNSAIVILIVNDPESNIFDQKVMIFKILEIQPDVVIKRYTLSQVAELGHVDAAGKLFV